MKTSVYPNSTLGCVVLVSSEAATAIPTKKTCCLLVRLSAYFGRLSAHRDYIGSKEQNRTCQWQHKVINLGSVGFQQRTEKNSRYPILVRVVVVDIAITARE